VYVRGKAVGISLKEPLIGYTPPRLPVQPVVFVDVQVNVVVSPKLIDSGFTETVRVGAGETQTPALHIPVQVLQPDFTICVLVTE